MAHSSDIYHGPESQGRYEKVYIMREFLPQRTMMCTQNFLTHLSFNYLIIKDKGLENSLKGLFCPSFIYCLPVCIFNHCWIVAHVPAGSTSVTLSYVTWALFIPEGSMKEANMPNMI